MTPQEKKVIELALEALENNRQTHNYCEDTWYSCPKHEEGCANESEGDECNCGADEANAEIDNAITATKELLAQPEQEPVAWYDKDGVITANPIEFSQPLYTTSPQPEKLDQDEVDIRSRLYQRIHELETQLAQPEQEPVGSLSVRYHRGCKSMTNTDFDYNGDLPEGDYELYTTPPQRKPLTCFDTEKLAKQCGVEWTTRIDKLCKLAIEAAHNIKE